MPNQTRIVTPTQQERCVRTADGQVLDVPADWELLPPGDAALTRRVKAQGPTWCVQEKQGRRTFSRGVWAPTERVASIKRDLAAERSTEAYAKRRNAEANRRERKQSEYVEDFQAAVVAFLNFAECHAEIAKQLAVAVTEHATPVGSGTVARTQRIPIAKRAESAVIAWMRHQTTAYDDMKIERVKGRRREVRQQLAQQSRRVLAAFRSGDVVNAATCPLQRALSDSVSYTADDSQPNTANR